MRRLTCNNCSFNGGVQYYNQVYLNDNLIIAVYAKESRIDAGKAGTEIHMFEWEGRDLPI